MKQSFFSLKGFIPLFAALGLAACGAPADMQFTDEEVPGAPAQPSPAPEEPDTAPSPAPAPSPVEPIPVPRDPVPSPVEPLPAPVPADPVSPPVDPLAGLSPCAVGVVASFKEDKNALPDDGSEGYRVPQEFLMSAMRRSFDSFLAGDVKAATEHARTARYTLCRGTGAESSLVFWQPPAREGQALVTLRTGKARPVILETPHPFFDGGTMDQGALMFRTLNARVLISAGTHRCANRATAGCDGTSTACGGGDYRISDMAHTEQSIYHVAHMAFAEHFQDDWVLQLHGMGASGVSVSDGTSLPTTPVSPSARVALALSKAFSGVTTCNAFKGVASRNHMCGTSNTQGRHLNGSSKACTQEGDGTSGRFIHLEQSSTVRKQPAKVADVLSTVLPL